jgi:predicted Zn-ribbon and HTH transcriptional regulator
MRIRGECKHCGFEDELIDGLCPQCHAEYMNLMYGN